MNNAELHINKKEQNAIDRIKSACIWLDKVISQFHNPSAGIVTTARLMGLAYGDLLFRMAGSFPALNGDSALNAIISAGLDGVAQIDHVGTDFWDGEPIYWEIQLFDFSDKTSMDWFPEPICTYLVNLDGVVIDCRDADYNSYLCFGENFYE